MNNKHKKNNNKSGKRSKQRNPSDEAQKIITGKIDLVGSHAFLIPDTGEKDLFVALQNLRTALHGDLVRASVSNRTKRPEAKVIEVIERSKTRFVGTVELGKNFAFLVPADTKHVPYDIYIPQDMTLHAQSGEKAVVEILDWGTAKSNPTGKVIEVLGKAGENTTEMHAILAEFGLPNKFPEEVLHAATLIPSDITASEIKKRRDFRDTFTITIDPQDAKDFDDALSLKYLDDDKIEVGVHIADVSFYVEENDLIDKEALLRATSIYLVDRTIPMLPEKLSNGLCSLRPDEEKLCYSAVFTMDNKGNVLDKWFGRTVIKSNRRYNYDEVQVMIDTQSGEFIREVLTLHQAAQELRSVRVKKGAILFDRSEPKFILDKNGKPLGVVFAHDSSSHQLIEEFMLLANRSVAELIGKPMKKGDKPKTFVYRIHEQPNAQKLTHFGQFISRFGYKFQPQSDKEIPRALNSVLNALEGKTEKELIESLALKAMAKAQYSTHNVGHYGLAFDFYTHFTSPIRRYPDLLVHRLLTKYFDGQSSVNQKEYEDLCTHCSNKEQLAVSAERASIKYKTVEFMQDKVGMTFEGVVSSVSEWGLYVELDETKIEGMIPLRTIKSDFFYFDEENYTVVGKHSQVRYTLGDRLKIKVVSANMEKKQLTFELLEE